MKDKKYEYINKWNSRLFLHRKNTDKNLTLGNTYIMPNFKCGERHSDSFEEFFEEFLESDESTFFIMGIPGIGKSSIVSFIVNHYNDVDFIVLQFKLMKEKDLKEGLLGCILKILKCDSVDINSRIMILDGFDELNYSGSSQELLNNFMLDIKLIDGLKVIITSRENYVNEEFLKGIVIHLERFNKRKIKQFAQFISGNKEININYKNIDVLGIPVILYMALAVEIDITENSNKCELYERIFAINGGIFDRFENQFIGYDKGAHPLTYYKIKFDKILQNLAYYLFSNNLTFVTKNIYENIVNNVIGKIDKKIIYEFPIKNLFENDNNIEYVHKSIYEYYTSLYIYNQIKEKLKLQI